MLPVCLNKNIYVLGWVWNSIGVGNIEIGVVYDI